MREIKFRFFHKALRQMLPIRSIYFNEPSMGPGFSVNDGLTMLSPEELMHFTGLKDKNGRDIYEGDIIDRIEPSAVWERGDVQLRNGAFRVHAFVLCELECEVIGNIYENPDLLT